MNTLSGSFSPSKKPQPKPAPIDSPESFNFKDVPKAIVHESQEAVRDMWAQIMGTEQHAKQVGKQAGELQVGQELSLKDIAKKNEQSQEAPISYFREIQEAGKSGISRETHEIQQQVQTIMYELQRLATTSKAIEKQVARAIGTGVMKPGKYHVAFFEWMLTIISDARKRVENAGAWIGTVKKKKGFVQGMKKNMSQFLSGERSVSNQTA